MRILFKDSLIILAWLIQIPEQFRFMSQNPVKKKHRHKKHKGQDSERNKDGGEAVGQGTRTLEQDKLASSSTGTAGYLFLNQCYVWFPLA